MKKLSTSILTLAVLALIVPDTASARRRAPRSPLETRGARANFGAISLQEHFPQDPALHRVSSGGPVAASSVANGCAGFVASAADMFLDFRGRGGFLRLGFAPDEPRADTTMLVLSPSGQWFCNDDAEGRSPMVDLVGENGRYRIWIGSYSADQHHTGNVFITELRRVTPSTIQRPQAQQPFQQQPVRPQQPFQQQPVRPQGGLQPTVTVQVGNQGQQAQPFRPQQGQPFRPQQGQPFRPQRPQQAPQVEPRFGTMHFSAGFTPDPYTARGTTRARRPAARLGLRGCSGFYGSRPEYVMVLDTPIHYLRIEARSPRDTTLAILGPNGNVYCDDDTAGNGNPRIAGSFPAGVYQVHVGSFNQRQRARYTVQFSEYTPQQQPVVHHQQPHHQPQPQHPQHPQPHHPQPHHQQPNVVIHNAQPAPPRPSAVPDCRQILLQQGHNASYLRHCQNAEPYCAAALLRAGHNPTYLRNCTTAIEPHCAESLLQAGHNPTYLRNCTRNLSPGCTQTLLQRGHNPTYLRNCAGVDDRCATTLLQQGQNPTYLRQCR